MRAGCDSSTVTQTAAGGKGVIYELRPPFRLRRWAPCGRRVDSAAQPPPRQRRVAFGAGPASNGAVIPEAPFLFSIAGLSASLAGLAGLVAGLRRAEGVQGRDLFRLREIVEFSFANVLLAVGVVPLALAVGSVSDAVRVAGLVAVGYLLFTTIVLIRRQRQAGIPSELWWYVPAAAIDLAVIGAGLIAVTTGAVPAYEAMLVGLLARPMVAFLFVLNSFARG